MPGAALLSLLCLLGQAPASPKPEPSPQRALHAELLVTLLGVGGALEVPLGQRDALVLEAGVGPQLGLALGSGPTMTGGSSADFSGLAGSFAHLGLGWRRRASARTRVDVGMRIADLNLSLSSGVEGPSDSLFVGAYLRPSFGAGKVRYSFTVAAGPVVAGYGKGGVAVLVLPLTLAFF